MDWKAIIFSVAQLGGGISLMLLAHDNPDAQRFGTALLWGFIAQFVNNPANPPIPK